MYNFVGANSKCFSISFAVRRPEAVFSDSSCNFLPASLRSYSNLSSPDTSRSMCSLIVLTVFGFADSLITGSIGFPMMLPCPVVKRCRTAPAAAKRVTAYAAADEVFM